MRSVASVAPAMTTVGLSVLFSLSGFGLADVLMPTERTQIAACFTIAGKMTCMEGGAMPINPIMPPILIPSGPGVDGEDEVIIMNDNGGHEVAIG